MTEVDWVTIKDLQGKIFNYSKNDKSVDSIRLLKDKIIIKYNMSSPKGTYKKIIVLQNIVSYDSPDRKIKPLFNF